MSSHPSIDRESFQTFLADAFAVQESGLDAQSVGSLVEIQQFIASAYFDLDRAMRMVADRARKICSASGVAVATFEGNELVYRAGSGCAAQDIGRRVPAVLSVSSPREMREILRVEDATTDSRIEAHICRQFGGVALLMLPIWKQGRLAGVLQVLFDEAHSFDEREVRTYRLMVGALEYGMVQQKAHRPDMVTAVEHASDIRVEPTRDVGVQSIARPAIPTEASGQFVPQPQFAQRDAASFTQSAKEIVSDDPTIQDRLGDFWWVLTSSVRDLVGRLWNSNLWNAGAAVTAVLAFSVSIWIYHRAHNLNPQIDLSTPTSHDVGAGTVAKSPSAIDGAKAPGLSGVWKGTRGSLASFMRMRVGPNEVDYIADDVTIRQFENMVSKARNKNGVKQVDFGDDVTVRYFANAPLPVSERSSSSEASPSGTQATETVIKER